MTKAKEYLNYVRDLGQHINAKLEYCEQLRKLAAMSSPSISSDKVSGGNKQGSKLEDHVVKIMTIEHDMRYEVYELLEVKNKAMAAINKMPEVRDRTLLVNRYINGHSWGEVAKEMVYSLAHAKGYAHKKALESFSENFDVNTH